MPLSAQTHDAAVAIIIEGLTEHWGSYEAAFNPDLGDLFDAYGHGSTVVAVVDGTVVGTATLLPRELNVAEIVRMSVSSGARRLGVGRKLVAHLIALARSWECEQVILETTVGRFLRCGGSIGDRARHRRLTSCPGGAGRHRRGRGVCCGCGVRRDGLCFRSLPITEFYEAFAARLESPDSFAPIAAANQADIESAQARGRTTTRLELTPSMRADMVSGLRTWAGTASLRNQVEETIEHDGWKVDQVTSGLGVVGFVFEGRPNVFADATGVLRSGNTVVFRIGSDALGTAKAIVEHALEPALAQAGLPQGAVSLVASAAHAAGWALFSDSRLALAVARGSGAAVSQLGSVARQAGIPVSLHGTGGAWIVAAADADPESFGEFVYNSLDRKVCNTLNTCCIVADQADTLVPAFLAAIDRAGQRRGAKTKLHVVADQLDAIPNDWRTEVLIGRAEGDCAGTADRRPLTGRTSDTSGSGRTRPSLASADADAQQRFFERIDAPFVGNGFTRWVDGQYALDRPELGLSNWEFGRLFGRGGVLSGDSVFTVRSRVTQIDPTIGPPKNELLTGVKASQALVIDGLKNTVALADRIVPANISERIEDRVATVPSATPVIDGAFDFATKLLAAQRDFVGEIGGDRIDPVAAFGDYVRSQRKLAQLSLRQLADLTSLSNPYLSKLERGLHQPSVNAVTSLAKALGVPAETLLAKAAGLVPGFSADDEAEAGPTVTTVQAIKQDPELTDDQKLALLSVYHSFVDGDA
ncbi:Gamma-glutamyl phosphate reductase [Nymphon striatum]|nr:Gamma-glutamyl phosphate reductase [Nymphon striatum]